MAAQQRLRLGSILSMGIWRDPSSWRVYRDDYSLTKHEIHQGMLQEPPRSPIAEDQPLPVREPP